MGKKSIAQKQGQGNVQRRYAYSFCLFEQNFLINRQKFYYFLFYFLQRKENIFFFVNFTPKKVQEVQKIKKKSKSLNPNPKLENGEVKNFKNQRAQKKNKWKQKKSAKCECESDCRSQKISTKFRLFCAFFSFFEVFFLVLPLKYQAHYTRFR